ncbi:cell division protein FtsQ/DivIB [Pontixanthobacter aquaemixtae]|uniref:Cell division protein FtsQ n=1 Tax=Pontixanthobacter aquaemixtae TaxID=1958940 RepID=A0A844ZMC8_9SPHN|nr:FtsQ-type POTRA domain-containing protein [Pontixanthobacter aquaemixtae]MXO89551.1 FtsQ-type POTRA domain-containing protein [Pontixanthobacter aquaemixtae]
MATVKRNAKGVRRSAAAKGRANTARKAKARTSSAMDSVMAILPFTEEQLQRVFLAIILGGGVALAWFVASLAGVPAMAQQQIAGLATSAGFEVRHVSITGVDRMNELKVYNQVLGEQDRPMPLVDIEAIRADLLALSWVEDARVSRQLPDRLVIDIVERTPHAVLAKADRLVLIDPTGEELEPISQANAKGMLVITGPGARKQVAQLTELLDAAPALKPQVAKAEWIGNRRWNLTFSTDQVLALPQGKGQASSALVAFARLDGKSRLLGGKVATFDMRAPERIYMRIPGRSEKSLDVGGGS